MSVWMQLASLILAMLDSAFKQLLISTDCKLSTMLCQETNLMEFGLMATKLTTLQSKATWLA